MKVKNISKRAGNSYKIDTNKQVLTHSLFSFLLVGRKISYALLKPRSIDYTWIGMSDVEEEGVWEWVDGSPVTDHAHWNSHQPDDHGEGQDCGAIWSESRDYRSDDGACHYKAYALCEKALDILPDH